MIGETTCPNCGRVNDCHSDTEGNLPNPGDVSICWKCSYVAVFTEDGVRSPTPEEEAEFAVDPWIQRAREAISKSYTPSEAVGLLADKE